MAGHRLIRTAIIAAVLTATACSGDGRFDRAETEVLARTELNRVLPVTVTAVDCEHTPRRSTGDREPCVAALSGGEHVDIELVSVGDGDIEVELVDAVMDSRALADRIAVALRGQLERRVEVDCGRPGVIVATVGDVLVCETRDDPETGEVDAGDGAAADDATRGDGEVRTRDGVREVEVRIVDVDGDVELRSIESAGD